MGPTTIAILPARGLQTFVGPAVILACSETGGGLDHWDVWTPPGRCTPSWNRVEANDVLTVLGGTRDGRYAIGQSGAAAGSSVPDMCLALLDPSDALRAVTRACDLPNSDGEETGLPSPGGHWLAYGSATSTIVVDATALSERSRAAAIWSATSMGIWTGPDTYVAQGDDGRFYRYLVGRSTAEQVNIIGMPSGSTVILVPKLS